MRSCNSTPEHIFREKIDPKVYMYLNVRFSTVYNNQDMEASLMYINT